MPTAKKPVPKRYPKAGPKKPLSQASQARAKKGVQDIVRENAAQLRATVKATAKKPTKSAAKEAEKLKNIVIRQAKPKASDIGRPKAGDQVDWEAVERDYRTGRFTNVELGRTYGVHKDSIARRVTKEGWTKDLRAAVRQATHAAVLTAESAIGLQKVSDTVQAAAEVNKQVILGHRQDIKSLRDQGFALLKELQAANGTMDELRSMLETLEDLEISAIEGDPDLSDMDKEGKMKRLRKKFDAITKLAIEAADIHNRVGSAQKLMDIIVKAQTLERKAFDLDTDPSGKNKAGYEEVLDQLLD